MAGVGAFRRRGHEPYQGCVCHCIPGHLTADQLTRLQLRRWNQHVRHCKCRSKMLHFVLALTPWRQVYSNGLSEVILGKAIKKFNLPRDEIVVMSKVGRLFSHFVMSFNNPQVFFVVGRTPGETFIGKDTNPEGHGYVNQRGLNRKAISLILRSVHPTADLALAYFWFCQA